MNPSKPTIPLGFEVGTGAAVHIPAHHLIATGTTQLSGKTTTLEALVTRSGLRAVAFLTKRGEGGFTTGRRHAPFFRERADWQYVQSILEATMRERLKFERSWIIQATKGAHTLEEVRANVEARLEKARGISEGVYTNLKAYLDIVIPVLQRVTFATELVLQPGINVMDLAGLPEEVQGLVIASTIDAIHKTEKGTVTILPEAWKFVPEGRGSPVKLAVEKLIREGAALGNYVWFDSQDITGVDKTPLKSVEVWILGRQRELNEVQRTLAQIPVPKKDKPAPEEVARLHLGHFYVCAGDKTRLVYVQPAWMTENDAIRVATGHLSIRDINRPTQIIEEPEDMTKEEVLQLQARIAELEKENHDLKARPPARTTAPAAPAPAAHAHQSGRVIQAGPILIEARERVADIHHSEEVREFATTGARGCIMYALIHDLKNQPSQEGDISAAMRERGWNYSHQTMAPELAKLVKAGDLITDGNRPAKYRAPGNVKIRIKHQGATQ